MSARSRCGARAGDDARSIVLLGVAMRLVHRFTLPTCVLALAACGGGGGSDPTVTVPTGARAGTASAGSDLTAANATAFVGPWRAS
jgi:hypothetical protein